MKWQPIPAIAAIMLGVSLAVSPAAAITAGDVQYKMEPREGSGFIAGAVDMASYLLAKSGDVTKADCAVNWYFGNAEATREIFEFFEAHQELDAVGIIAVLIDRHCGK